ncbi:MAG: AlkZ family DNA glycosylase [Actinobacteria bacterium]|nr:AlkZ family DNA glycosylase [Actinomycetota bacterium]
MRSFSPAERRARLARRHFLSGAAPADSVAAVTCAVVGLHSTDPTTPYLSLWARVPGFAIADLDDLLYRRRALVKHLAMRRTLWTVRAEDLPMIQTAGSARVAVGERRRLIADAQKAGLAEDGAGWLDAACGAVLRHLDEHGAATSSQLRAALPELAGTYDPAPGKRWGGQTPLAPRVLTVLSAAGEIVRATNDGGWAVSRPRWASARYWLGAPIEPAHADQASAEAVRRWLRTFGPGTAVDVKWWFGSTLTWARHTLRAIGAVEVDLGGAVGYALPDDLEPEPGGEPWAALLPGLDVTAMGWSDRDWYLGEHRPHVFDTNGNAGPTAWWNGRIVGAWGQDADGRVEVRPVEDVGRDGTRALNRRAAELTAWLDGARVSPRFPSPLSRASPG